MYYKWEGFSQDVKKAKALLESLLELEHYNSVKLLIEIYYKENNIQRAKELLELGERAENTPVLLVCGTNYRDGKILEQDYEKAIKYY